MHKKTQNAIFPDKKYIWFFNLKCAKVHTFMPKVHPGAQFRKTVSTSTSAPKNILSKKIHI